MRANDLQLNCSNYVYARLQGNRMPTRSYEHLVGAYGVVGFSGVKDARKSVVRCRRSAEARSPTPGLRKSYRKTTDRQQGDYKATAEKQRGGGGKRVG